MYDEIPVIPMKRYDAIELIYEKACDRWTIIIDRDDWPDYEHDSHKQILFLDRLWQQLMKEHDVESLSYVISIMPLNWQWRWYKDILVSQFKHYGFFCWDALTLLERYIDHRYIGLSEIYQLADSVCRMAKASLLGADSVKIFQELDDLNQWFHPFIGSFNDPEIDWTAPPVQQYLLDNFYQDNYEKCPFYFIDDPLTLKTRMAKEKT